MAVIYLGNFTGEKKKNKKKNKKNPKSYLEIIT